MHRERGLVAAGLLAAALLAAVSPGLAAADTILLGRIARPDILTISVRWQEERDRYAPAPDDIRILSALPRRTRLDVYFGSWCGDSAREVPRLLKILDEASPRHLKVRFFALDRSKKEPAHLVEGLAIERVPTFILSADGTEVGRIVETPQTTLEHDLAQLVGRVPAERP